jgi:predicted Fe-Mo cluster-binding NifX family protein
MKVAVSAVSPTLEADVDPRFGRCQYFVVVDTETMQFKSIDNSSAASSGGAGIAAAQLLTGQGIDAVLTGNCGPNAFQVLSPAGIKVITGVSGKVKDVVLNYVAGKLPESPQANVPGHFGMGAGPGKTGGSGGGKGGGHGMGCMSK